MSLSWRREKTFVSRNSCAMLNDEKFIDTTNESPWFFDVIFGNFHLKRWEIVLSASHNLPQSNLKLWHFWTLMRVDRFKSAFRFSSELILCSIYTHIRFKTSAKLFILLEGCEAIARTRSNALLFIYLEKEVFKERRKMLWREVMSWRCSLFSHHSKPQSHKI